MHQFEKVSPSLPADAAHIAIESPAAAGASGRQWGIGTRPGGSSSVPVKNLETSARVRGVDSQTARSL